MVVVAGPAADGNGGAIIEAADVELWIAALATQRIYQVVIVGYTFVPLPNGQGSDTYISMRPTAR